MRFQTSLLVLLLFSGGVCAAEPPVMWRFSAKGTVYSDIVVDGGVIYFATSSGAVYGLNKTTGQVVLNYTAPAAVYSTPAVTEGRVVFGCDNNIVYALNRSSGARVWSFLAKGRIRSNPVFSDGVVYVGSDDTNLYALNESSGKMLWRYKTNYAFQSTPLAERWKIYFGLPDRRAYCLSTATRGVLWNYTTKGALKYAPVMEGDVLYFASGDRGVYALDKYTGAALWNYTTNGSIAGSPVVSNGSVLFSSGDRRVYRVDAVSGNLTWSTLLNESMYASPAAGDGVVYAGGGANLYAINESSGEVLWRMNASVRTKPAYSEGIVYFASGSSVTALGRNADIEIVSIGPRPQIPVAGRPYRLIVGVRNDGNAIAADVGVDVYVDRTAESRQNVTLRAGEFRALEYWFNASYGSQVAEVVVDRENRITEADEYNNRAGMVFSVSGEWPTFKQNARRTGDYGFAQNYSVRNRVLSWTCKLNDTNRTMGDVGLVLDAINSSWGSPIGDLALNHTCYLYQTQTRGYPVGRAYSNWSCRPQNATDNAWRNYTAMADYIRRFNETAYNRSVRQGYLRHPYNMTDYTVLFNCTATPNGELPTPEAALVWSCKIKRGLNATPYNLTGAWACTTRYYSNHSLQDLAEFKGYGHKRGGNILGGGAYVRDYRPLWNYSTGGAVRSSPVVSDLDADGRLEVVAASTDGRVYALTPDGIPLWNYSAGGPVYSTPTLDDLDGDGRLEVVFGSDDGRLYVLNSSGGLRWSFPTGGRVRSSPLTAGLDVLPGPEIVFSSFDSRVYCLHADGGIVWNYSVIEPADSSQAVVDLDGDRNLEVVVGSTNNIVYVLKNPSKVWSYQTGYDISQTPVVDPSNYIYVPSGRTLYKLRYSTYTDAEEIQTARLYSYWTYNASDPITDSPAYGLLDNDSKPDFVFAAGNELTAVNGNGSRILRYSVSKTIKSTPALADLNGDGVREIVFGSGEGSMFIVDYPGEGLWSYDLGCPIESSPALADLNGDGALEIIVGCDDGRVYAFSSWNFVGEKDAVDIYQKALKRFEAGELGEAEVDVMEARTEFAKIGDAEWVLKCNNMLESINGRRWYYNATKAYGRKDYNATRGYLDSAIMFFTLSNDTAGLAKTSELAERMDADAHFMEAKHHYIKQEYEAALGYAEAAREHYVRLGDRYAINDADTLISAIRQHVKAEDKST